MSSHGIIGPMGAGKTEKLLEIIRIDPSLTCKIKFAGDKRFSNEDEIVSHNKNRTVAKSYSSFKGVNSSVFDVYSTIYIDEIQFIEDSVRMVKELVKKGKMVINKLVLLIFNN